MRSWGDGRMRAHDDHRGCRRLGARQPWSGGVGLVRRRRLLAAGGWAHGTNNKAELTAVLDLLQQTAHLDDDLLVYCDSTYVINSVTKWMAGWKRRGWRKGDGKPVLNVEIMVALDEAMAGRRVRFAWVKGHSGRAERGG